MNGASNDTERADVLHDVIPLSAEYRGITWTADSHGVFYVQESRCRVKGAELQLMYHRIGSNSREDVFIQSCFPGYYPQVTISDNGRYFFLRQHYFGPNRVFDQHIDTSLAEGRLPVYSFYVVDLGTIPASTPTLHSFGIDRKPTTPQDVVHSSVYDDADNTGFEGDLADSVGDEVDNSWSLWKIHKSYVRGRYKERRGSCVDERTVYNNSTVGDCHKYEAHNNKTRCMDGKTANRGSDGSDDAVEDRRSDKLWPLKYMWGWGTEKRVETKKKKKNKEEQDSKGNEGKEGKRGRAETQGTKGRKGKEGKEGKERGRESDKVDKVDKVDKGVAENKLICGGVTARAVGYMHSVLGNLWTSVKGRRKSANVNLSERSEQPPTRDDSNRKVDKPEKGEMLQNSCKDETVEKRRGWRSRWPFSRLFSDKRTKIYTASEPFSVNPHIVHLIPRYGYELLEDLQFLFGVSLCNDYVIYLIHRVSKILFRIPMSYLTASASRCWDRVRTPLMDETSGEVPQPTLEDPFTQHILSTCELILFYETEGGLSILNHNRMGVCKLSDDYFVVLSSDGDGGAQRCVRFDMHNSKNGQRVKHMGYLSDTTITSLSRTTVPLPWHDGLFASEGCGDFVREGSEILLLFNRIFNENVRDIYPSCYLTIQCDIPSRSPSLITDAAMQYLWFQHLELPPLRDEVRLRPTELFPRTIDSDWTGTGPTKLTQAVSRGLPFLNAQITVLHRELHLSMLDDIHLWHGPDFFGPGSKLPTMVVSCSKNYRSWRPDRLLEWFPFIYEGGGMIADVDSFGHWKTGQDLTDTRLLALTKILTEKEYSTDKFVAYGQYQDCHVLAAAANAFPELFVGIVMEDPDMRVVERSNQPFMKFPQASMKKFPQVLVHVVSNHESNELTAKMMPGMYEESKITDVVFKSEQYTAQCIEDAVNYIAQLQFLLGEQSIRNKVALFSVSVVHQQLQKVMDVLSPDTIYKDQLEFVMSLLSRLSTGIDQT
eukprot:GHVQ01018985.1.p1 GENE.GHVQ01018985.1~~GHVQ01018985.1.p1  ORF type:complete len:994 (+),score=140.35 GHVQ01018985.1:1257-4238(+)